MYESAIVFFSYVGLGLTLLSLLALAKLFIDGSHKWGFWTHIPFLILWVFMVYVCINFAVRIFHG